MLEGLDRIDWAGLSASAAVPDHLRGLQSPDHARRESSFEALYDHLGFHGQVARAAIPFLVAIACGAPHGRGYAALLLCSVARGARLAGDQAVRQALEDQRGAVRQWSGPGVIDARAFLLSCLDRFDAGEERAERKVLRKLREAVSELEAD